METASAFAEEPPQRSRYNRIASTLTRNHAEKLQAEGQSQLAEHYALAASYAEIGMMNRFVQFMRRIADSSFLASKEGALVLGCTYNKWDKPEEYGASPA
jgi:hypothetical protein